MADSGIVFADDALTDRLPNPLFLPTDTTTLRLEYKQLRDAGRDLTPLDDEFTELMHSPEAADYEARATTLMERAQSLEQRPDYGYVEPTPHAAIRDRSPSPPDLPSPETRGAVTDAIHGGWLGACAGCLLGKPVQGWSRARIRGFLEDSDQAPLTTYLTSDVSTTVQEQYDIHQNLEPIDAFIDEVDGMPIDDDIDYIVAGIDAMRSHGTDLDSIDIASTWLSTLPLFNTYTAERIAYRNLTNQIMPPESATHRNPYREMIGGLIRADPWGFVAIGDPQHAATLAHRDARISHVKNGVYGEMWAAAMIAAAPVADDIDTVIDAGLSVIPARSRLTDAVEVVRRWHAEAIPYPDVADRIHDRWDETALYDWVHTLPNAQIVVAALLYSDGDFGPAVCNAVETGFDTDSHAATIGSILGAYHGATALPTTWTDPLADTVQTSLPARGQVSITTLAETTADLWVDTAA